jgi:hypothetical protein
VLGRIPQIVIEVVAVATILVVAIAVANFTPVSRSPSKQVQLIPDGSAVPKTDFRISDREQLRRAFFRD